MVGAISFFIQTAFHGVTQSDFVFLLKKSYTFHFLFSLTLVLAFEFLSKVKKMVDQLGFIYIGLLVFKIVVFSAMFQSQLMGDELLPHFYRVMILIPIFIFLTLEVIFVSKILRNK